MFNEATLREILLQSSGNVNACVTHIYRKHADLDENNKLTDKNKLRNVTN